MMEVLPPSLDSLRIDRGERGLPRPRGARWGGRLAVLGLLAGALWLFQRPLLGLVERLRLPGVQVARALERDPRSAGALSGTAANGYVVARVRAALSADTPGRIVELTVVEGTRVSKGDVVARLYADEHEAALRQAEADLALARATTERVRAERAAAETALESRAASLRAARALLEEVQAGLVYAEGEHRRVEQVVSGGFESERARDLALRELQAARAQVAAAEARVAAAEGDAAEARERLVVAERALDEMSPMVLMKEAARDHAQATLEKTFVRAPFDGIVVSKEAEVGEVVSPSSQGGSNARGSVATLVDLASLEVQADVPETSLGAVRIGAPARIFLDAFPERPYAGRVDRVWPMADRQRATVEVRVVFLDPDERLRPEMGVRVVFLSEEPGEAEPSAEPGAEPLVLVPAGALVRRAGGTAVFVLEGDRAHLRPVTLARSDASRADLRAGLSAGELVVMNPPSDLTDGQRVRVLD